MLSNTLNTNEVKDAAGTEVEFSRISTNGRSTEYAKVGEVPNAPYRLKVSHQETGSGLDLFPAFHDSLRQNCRWRFWFA